MSGAKRLQAASMLSQPISFIISPKCVFNRFYLNSKLKMQILFSLYFIIKRDDLRRRKHIYKLLAVVLRGEKQSSTATTVYQTLTLM